MPPKKTRCTETVQVQGTPCPCTAQVTDRAYGVPAAEWEALYTEWHDKDADSFTREQLDEAASRKLSPDLRLSLLKLDVLVLRKYATSDDPVREQAVVDTGCISTSVQLVDNDIADMALTYEIVLLLSKIVEEKSTVDQVVPMLCSLLEGTTCWKTFEVTCSFLSDVMRKELVLAGLIMNTTLPYILPIRHTELLRSGYPLLDDVNCSLSRLIQRICVLGPPSESVERIMAVINENVATKWDTADIALHCITAFAALMGNTTTPNENDALVQMFPSLIPSMMKALEAKNSDRQVFLAVDVLHLLTTFFGDVIERIVKNGVLTHVPHMLTLNETTQYQALRLVTRAIDRDAITVTELMEIDGLCASLINCALVDNDNSMQVAILSMDILHYCIIDADSIVLDRFVDLGLLSVIETGFELAEIPEVVLLSIQLLDNLLESEQQVAANDVVGARFLRCHTVDSHPLLLVKLDQVKTSPLHTPDIRDAAAKIITSSFGSVQFD